MKTGEELDIVNNLTGAQIERLSTERDFRTNCVLSQMSFLSSYELREVEVFVKELISKKSYSCDIRG